MDTLTSAQGSERMSRVRSKDTKPEMVVRRLVHRMGFRYRLHVRNLPGNPDLVFPSRGKIIFVHGCVFGAGTELDSVIARHECYHDVQGGWPR